RKLPPMTLCGANPIEWTTPSRPSTCSETRSASASRSSVELTSRCTTGASAGSRREITWVSRYALPKLVSTTVAPSCWASLATWNANELSTSTPVTRMRLPSSSPTPGSFRCSSVRSVPHAEAAVDRDDGAADVGGVVGRDELDGCRDLLRLREATRGDGGAVLLLRGLGQRLRHRGVDVAGRDDVARDATPAELTGDRAGHADQRRLRRGVVDLAGRAVQPDDRGDEHDATVAAAHHVLRHPTHAPERPGEVDVEDVGEVLVRHPHEQRVLGDTGVGDQHLHRAQLGLDRGERRVDRGAVAHVGDGTEDALGQVAAAVDR